ncbi:MAG: hypothetical protein FK733_08115, partial [Asgard group archaeon]|nr:hypothetical protein [Asgard group archaeon]
MKKFTKITLVMVIVCSFIMAQNIQAEFGVEVGQVVKFKIKEARNEITFANLADTFTGCIAGSSTIKEGSIIKVMVESITASQLKWNSTYESDPFTGICPATTDLNTFMYFVIMPLIIST